MNTDRHLLAGFRLRWRAVGATEAWSVAVLVFVAGLDQQVIERAIELRYADPRERAHAEPDPPASGAAGTLANGHYLGPAAGGISGRDYIKKIFQVPFGLPSVDRSQLEELVPRLVAAHRLPQAQESDLRGRILKHLQ